MEKIHLLLFLIGFVAGSPLGNNIDLDFKGICLGMDQGEQFPHPNDCSSYYVCNNGRPTLINCARELHYDRHHQVCNWPKEANCVLGLYPEKWNNTKSTTKPTIKPTTKHPVVSTTRIPTKPSINTTPSSSNDKTTPVYCMPKLSNVDDRWNSSTGAINEHGQIVNPLENYNPMNVQCYHNGLYFLPHPANCEKYFICSHHILFIHSCGKGIYWNYETERCELHETSKCYFYEQMITKSPTTTTTTKRRKPTKPPTTKLTTISTTTTIAPTTATVQITTISNLPKCPSKEQKFMPHPTDCSKYYICIAGEAALTSCPQGMYWDEREEWCAYPEFTYCRAALNV